MISFGPVIGGQMWRHLFAPSEHHSVVMRPEGFWDVMTGKTVHGNPILRVPRA